MLILPLKYKDGKIPYKVSLLDLWDEKVPVVDVIEAVNTFSIRNGRDTATIRMAKDFSFPWRKGSPYRSVRSGHFTLNMT